MQQCWIHFGSKEVTNLAAGEILSFICIFACNHLSPKMLLVNRLRYKSWQFVNRFQAEKDHNALHPYYSVSSRSAIESTISLTTKNCIFIEIKCVVSSNKELPDRFHHYWGPSVVRIQSAENQTFKI